MRRWRNTATTQEEFLAMTLKDIRPPEDVEKLMYWMAPERIDSAHTIEWHHRCKDGRILDVEVFARDVDFNGERARLALIIDNTARRQAERQTERIIETSQDLIHVNDSYGKFVRVSPSTTAVLGYLPEELLGRGANEFIHPEDIEAVRDAMRSARQGRGGRASGAATTTRTATWCRCCGRACGRNATATTISSAAT